MQSENKLGLFNAITKAGRELLEAMLSALKNRNAGLCPICGHKLTQTCLGCGAGYGCTNSKCDYIEPCSCIDYEV